MQLVACNFLHLSTRLSNITTATTGQKIVGSVTQSDPWWWA